MAAPVLQVKRGSFANLPALRAGEPAFTTDTFDFYVGIDSTTNNNKFLGSNRYWTKETTTVGSSIKLVEGTNNGSNFVAFKAPNSLAGDVTYVLPGTQGGSSTVLTNDGSGNLSWSSGSFNATFTGITTFSDTTDSTTKDNGSVILEGGMGVEKSVNIGGNLKITGLSTFTGNAEFSGDIAVNGGDITTTATTFNLVNTTATTVNLAGAATALNLGATTGTATINNPTVVGSQTTQNLYNTVATTVNAFGAATTVGIGAASGTATINNATVTLANATTFNINGANPTVASSSTGTLTLFNTNLTAVNAFGAATNIQIGNSVGFTTIRGTLRLSGNTGVGVTAISTSATLAENSNTYLPTQAAVKAYVDAVDLTLGLNADTGGPSTVNTSQTLTISGTANEVDTAVSGQTVTVGLPNSVTVTTALTTPTVKATNLQANDGTTAITITNTTGAVGFANSVTISGDLYVLGNTTEVNTSALKVEDTLIDLGLVNSGGVLVAPTSDLNLDLGVIFNWFSGTAKKASVFWDDSAQRIALASEVSESSGVLTVSQWGAVEIGALWVNDCAGQSQVINCASGQRTLENITVDAGTF